jgi:hypothetical protein
MSLAASSSVERPCSSPSGSCALFHAREIRLDRPAAYVLRGLDRGAHLFSAILARHRASNRFAIALRAKDTRFIPLRTLTRARPRRSEAFLNSTSSSPSGARARTGMTALSQSRRRPHGWRGSYRSGLGGSQPMLCRNRSVDRLRWWSLTATGLPPASLRYRKALAGRISRQYGPSEPWALGRQTPRPTALTRSSLGTAHARLATVDITP